MVSILRYIFLAILLLACSLTKGELILPRILSDNLVLQQNSKVTLWGKATPGSNVTIQTDWSDVSVETLATQEGLWEVTLITGKAGGPYSIEIINNNEKKVLNNVLLGEVWICAGQSNMVMPIKGFGCQPVNNALNTIVESESYNQIRMFTGEKNISKEPEFELKGSWESAGISTTPNFSAVGYFYARELIKVLKVPIGIINIGYGGSLIMAWMSNETLKMFPEIDLSDIDINSNRPQKVPTLFYNGMVHPIMKYKVKGVVWYQGESDLDKPELYLKLFPAMVKEWRQNMNNTNLPFYYVQIAPFKYQGEEKEAAALFREIQLKCSELIPNSEMAVTLDIGDKDLIHPSDKETVGKRLSLISLAKTYGYSKLPYKGPVYKNKIINGNKVVLTFENEANGFIPTSLEGFEVASDNNVFVPAKARIKSNNQIEIWAEEINNPVHARYCFRNYVKGSLFNSYGLPASSFRTDN